MNLKSFELTFAQRDGSNRLTFDKKTVQATNRQQANRIGKGMECPADKLFFRADLTRELTA